MEGIAMKKLLLTSFMILLVSALILSGCAKPAPAPAPAPVPAPKPAPAPAPAAPIKIGIMYPLAGPAASVGEMMVAATKFGFEEAGYQVAGRKIEIIIEDEGGQAEVALDKARKLVEHDKVDMIIGPLVKVSSLAVAPYVSKMGVPLIYTSPLPLETATKYDWLFLAGGSLRQMVSPMGLYAYDKLGFRKVTALATDIADGHEFVDVFRDAIKARGGQVVQEQYPPFNCQDFAPYLTNLKDADAALTWFQGGDAIRFLIQYHEFGIRKRMPLQPAYFGGFVQLFLLRRLPPPVADAMIGEYTQTVYTSLFETDVSKRFAENWKNKFGYLPDDVHATPYLGVEVALRALKATGGDATPEKLRQAILSLDFESLEGHVRFDPQTRCAIRDAFICRIDKINGQYSMVPVYTYKDIPPSGL